MNKIIKEPSAWSRATQSEPKLILYKIELSASANRNLSPRTEYIKSRLGLKNLQESFSRFCTISASQYYGYTKVKIDIVKDIPEMMQITIQPIKLLTKRQVNKRKKEFEKQKNIVRANSPTALKRKFTIMRHKK